ncbi:MAG TPA: DUF3073 domain-containing protein [Actinospica sp.]|nr:DUF3073 domain-containing protein [Actinospica sp.]
MGRGRAKAKQTKVARQLKYQPAGDLDRLRSELGVSDPHPPSRSNGSRDHELDERYAAYADYAEDAEEDDDEEEDEDEEDSFPHR